jgi:hypothetical protein
LRQPEPCQGPPGWLLGRGAIFIAAHAIVAFGMMQKQYCLCVDDFAIVDHCRRFIERRLQDFNIFAFAFVFEPAAVGAKKVSF